MGPVNVLQDSCIPSNQVNMMFQSRIIWRDLASWIRAYLNSVYSGLPNQAAAVEKKIIEVLSENSNIIDLVFGEHNAEQYFDLLMDFVSISKSFVAAQVNNDTDAANEYAKQLYENANKRATFLSEINPFWSKEEWISLFYPFIQMTIEESTTLLNQEFDKNIEIYDRILNHTSKMGDYFSRGIIDYLTYKG